MLNSKKLTSAVLIAALSASSLVVAPNVAEAKTFNDVPKNYWAYNVIDEISNAKVMNGTAQNVFSPKKVLTRAEYTAILYNMAPDKHSSPTFEMSDLSSNDWFYDVAKWGVSNGIIFPIKGQFAGNEKVDRQYMAFMTSNFLDKYYPNALDETLSYPTFTDSDQIDENYKNSVYILAANKLIVGVGNNKFAPKATLTRAEAAAMASRVMNLEKEEPEKPPVKPEEPNKPMDPQDPNNPEEPQKPTVPQEPSEPEQPPVEESKPYPGDENAPEWMVKVKIENDSYTYVTKPDSMTTEQWEEVKEYYKDKEKPAEYPTSVSSYADPQAYMSYYIERLYHYVQQDKAKEALEAGTVQLSAEEQKMVDLVNAERRKAGVPELKVSPKLCEAARIRAKEVAKEKKSSHTRPNGTWCETVLDDVNLIYCDINNKVNSIAYGENVTLRHQGDFSAKDGFNNFLNSPNHKKNMLSDVNMYMGVSCVKIGKETAWIQSFGYLQ